MADRKRPPAVLLLIPVFIGLAGFNRVAQSPGFALYRTVDVVQLLASGACFGAVLVAIGVIIKRRRQDARSASSQPQ